MGREVNTVRDAIEALKFYEALGFDMLPVEVPVPSKTRPPVSRMPQKINVAMTPSAKKSALEKLRQEIGDCKKCRLSGGRTNLVFGEGNPDAPLMFIGEGPGAEEDRQGRPFVGEAGAVLTNLINRMGFDRESVYIGNIVKCRPPENRNPQEDEIAVCSEFIRKQIEIVSPKVIMALGNVSAHALMGVSTPIGGLRGKFFDYEDIPLMPTFHPAYLLRTPKGKFLVWEDALKVVEKLKALGIDVTIRPKNAQDA